MKPEEVGEKSLIVVNEARGIVINNNDDYERAKTIWAILVQRLREIDEAYDGIKEAAHATWKAIIAKKAYYYQPTEDGARLLKIRMGEYKTKKEYERVASEERLREEMRKREEERRLQEAINNPLEADAILNEPVIVAPVVVPNDLPKGGPVFREIWDAEVFDFHALIAAVAAGKVSAMALATDSAFLRKQAASLKGSLNIPGVRAFSRMV